MKRMLAALLVMAALAGSVGVVSSAEEKEPPERSVDATQPADITDVASVSLSLAAVTGAQLECAKGAEMPQECLCKATAELGALRTAFDAALKNHPAWKGMAVNFTADGKAPSTVSFTGVSQQLELCK